MFQLDFEAICRHSQLEERKASHLSIPDTGMCLFQTLWKAGFGVTTHPCTTDGLRLGYKVSLDLQMNGGHGKPPFVLTRLSADGSSFLVD